MIFINVFGKMDEKMPEKFFFLFNYDFQVHWPILLRSSPLYILPTKEKA